MDGSADPLWFKLKEVPKTTFQEKNSNFCARHSFFMKFFLLDRCTSQEGIASKILVLVSLAAQVREAKWNGNDTFWQCCFASRTWHQIQKFARNTFWDVHLSNKKIFMKKECVKQKLEFCSRNVVLGTSFSLNHSGSAFPSMTLPVKKSYLYEKWRFFHESFFVG